MGENKKNESNIIHPECVKNSNLEYIAYLFDFDGTIIDSNEMIYNTFSAISAKFFNYELDRKTVLNSLGCPFRQCLEHFFGKTKIDDSIYANMVEFCINFQKEKIKFLKVFPGMIELLTELKQRGKKVGLVTSRRATSVDDIIKHFKISQLFDVIITCESTIACKPNPDPVLYALHNLNLSPSQAIFIGDTGVDITCGYRANVDTGLVSWSELDVNKFPDKPTYIITHPQDLLFFKS